MPKNSYLWSSNKAEGSNSKPSRKQQESPKGCFSVYVGPQKQRFVIKTEFLNHPLFKMLLEDAESEYGFCCDGPLQLPCEVDLFCKVLAEMSSGKEIDNQPMGCGYVSCSPFNPVHRLGKNGYGSYSLLTPQHLLKINHS